MTTVPATALPMETSGNEEDGVIPVQTFRP
jgi:hypothetical protein